MSVLSSYRLRILAWTLLPLVLLVAHGTFFRFVIDDAFISFRYAQNLVDGHGLVFNPGEPVEGYSNLLWVLLISSGLKLGLPPLLWARILGVAAAAAMLALLPGVVRRLLPAGTLRGPWAGRAAQFLVAATGPVACWTLAGLETPLFGLLVVWAWRSALARNSLQAGAAGLLLALTRPEGPALALLFCAWSLLPGDGLGAVRSRLRQPGAWVGPALLVAGLVAHFLWRHSYYGWWLPNTFFAKTGDLSGQLRTGLPYGLAFLRFFAWAPLAAVAAALLRGGMPSLRRRDLWLSLGAVVLWWCYAVTVGGDMLGMFRFFAPLLPVLTTAMVALLAANGRLARSGEAILLTAVLAAALLPASFVGRERRLITAHMSEANLGGWMLAGDALAEILPPGSTIALGPAGYIPWRTGLVSYDFYGLVDPEIAHKKVEFTHGYAGHEKHDAALVMARRPHYVMIGNVDVTAAPRTALIPPLDRELDIVLNKEFQAAYHQIWVPIGGGRVLNMMQRKDLPALNPR